MFLLAGCWQSHEALVRAPRVEPPAASARHSGRLWLELEPLTQDRQCVVPDAASNPAAPGAELAGDDLTQATRPVCFGGIHDAVVSALKGALWASYPEVDVRGRTDELRPGDYLLLLDLKLDVAPPSADGPGWSAGVYGSWRLVRDGLPVRNGKLSERSPAELAYGRQLSLGAEVALRSAVVEIADAVSVAPEQAT